MTEQKEFVDFNVGLGDTGEDSLAAIQPLSDGEGATQVQFRRPSENLRERTETLRDTVGELLYYRDYSHLMIEYTGGTITWNGAAPGASPLGQITITAGSFTLAPMLAPYQEKKGTFSVGNPGSNQVIYTVAPTAYATHGMNAVTVKHLHSPGVGAVSVAISVGPVKRIVVTLDTGNIAHTAAAVQTALNSAIAADTALVGRLVITTNAVGGVAAAAVAETRLDTTADDEKHVVSGGDIQALTVATPLQPGMGIAVWYKYLIEPAGFGSDPKGGLAGGRAESSGNRGTSAIPAAALFVTSSNPEKIPGAIPLCRVGYTGQLIWYDGTRLEPGESFQFKSPTSVASTALSAFTVSLASVLGAALVGYNGSGFWADGVTAVTASTLEGAVDEVVADLAALTATSPGAIRIGVDAPTIFSGALTAAGGGGALTTDTTVRAALDTLDSAAVARRAFTAVLTRQGGGGTSEGGDYSGPTAIDVAFDSAGIFSNGGSFFLRQASGGSYYTLSNTVGNTVFGVDIQGEPSGYGYPEIQVATGRSADLVLGVGTLRNITINLLEATYFAQAVSTKLERCSLSTGIVAQAAQARSCTFGASNTLNRARSVLIKDSGSYHNCTFNKPSGSPTGSGEACYIDSTGSSTTNVLEFLNCVFYGGKTNTQNFAALRINQFLGGSLLFKNCVFSALDATFGGTLIDILNTNPASAGKIVFEDCVFYSSTGQILAVPGMGATFVRCKLETGGTTGMVSDPQIVSGYGYSAEQPLEFFDCTLDIGAANGSNVTDPFLELGGTNSTQAAGAYVHVDGLTIVYSGGAGTIANTKNMRFWSGSSTTNGYVNKYDNITINLNSVAVDSTGNVRLIEFTSSKLGLLSIKNLAFVRVQNPSIAGALACLLRTDYCLIDGLSLKQTNVVINSYDWDNVTGLVQLGNTQCKTVVWDASGLRSAASFIFISGSSGSNEPRASLIHVDIAEVGTLSVAGGSFIDAAGRVHVENVRAWGVAPGDAHVLRGSGPYCTFSKNEIYASTFTDGYAPLYLTSAADYSKVSDNTVIINTGTAIEAAIDTAAAAYCVVAGNIGANILSNPAQVTFAVTSIASANLELFSVTTP